MKKILLILILFTSFTAYSQKYPMKDIMRHFIQKDDSLQIIKKREIKKDSIIIGKNEIIRSDSLIIKRYKSDSLHYNNIIKNTEKIILNKDEEIKINKSEHKAEKRGLIKAIAVLIGVDVGLLVIIILILI